LSRKALLRVAGFTVPKIDISEKRYVKNFIQIIIYKLIFPQCPEDNTKDDT